MKIFVEYIDVFVEYSLCYLFLIILIFLFFDKENSYIYIYGDEGCNMLVVVLNWGS